MKKHDIDIAYEYAKENFNKVPFTFKELMDGLVHDKLEIASDASDLYVDMIQDIRFISLGKQKWSLRENYNLVEINKISSSIFGIEEYYEQNANIYMSDREKKEAIEQKEEKITDITEFLDETDLEDTDLNTPNFSEEEDSDLSNLDYPIEDKDLDVSEDIEDIDSDH